MFRFRFIKKHCSDFYLSFDCLIDNQDNAAMSLSQEPRVPLSVPHVAKAFGIPEVALRNWIRRDVVKLDDSPPGGWLRLSPRGCVLLTLAAGMRQVGFMPKKIRGLCGLVAAAYQERDARGIKPFLVASPGDGWVRVLCVEGEGLPSFTPPVRCWDLDAIEARFTEVLSRWSGKRPDPLTAETALHAAAVESA